MKKSKKISRTRSKHQKREGHPKRVLLLLKKKDETTESQINSIIGEVNTTTDKRMGTNRNRNKQNYWKSEHHKSDRTETNGIRNKFNYHPRQYQT